MNSKEKLIVTCVICGILIVAALVGVFMVFNHRPAPGQGGPGEVTVETVSKLCEVSIDKAEVYSQPNHDSSVLMQLNTGEIVNVVELRSDGFCKVTINNTVGYIEASKIVEKNVSDTTQQTAAQGQSQTMYIVNVENSAYLRSSPNENSQNITTIPLGASVEFIANEDGIFSRVRYNGTEGYVKTAFLTADVDTANSQVAQKSEQSHVTGTADNTVKYTLYICNVQNAAYLRKYAEENSDSICTISVGSPVGYIEDVTKNFCKVKYNGKIGYVKSEFLTSVSPNRYSARSDIGYITGVENSAYLRATPSESASKICTIPLGAAVTVVRNLGNGYTEVMYNGYDGYVKSKFIR